MDEVALVADMDAALRTSGDVRPQHNLHSHLPLMDEFYPITTIHILTHYTFHPTANIIPTLRKNATSTTSVSPFLPPFSSDTTSCNAKAVLEYRARVVGAGCDCFWWSRSDGFRGSRGVESRQEAAGEGGGDGGGGEP